MGWLKKRKKRRAVKDLSVEKQKEELEETVEREDSAKKSLCDTNDALEILMNTTLNKIGQQRAG